MAFYNPRLLGSSENLSRSPTSKEAEEVHACVNDRDSKSCLRRAEGIPYENNYLKNAQWSPDGTTILTSSADQALNSFILPPDLLVSISPYILSPYASHVLPEPANATIFYPSFSLQDPASTLFLVSLRSLPIRLYSPYAPLKVASYPLVSPTTEAFIAPHSLLFSNDNPYHFFAGNESCISLFDVQRDGQGPISRMHTTSSRRGGAGVGMKGIVSALGMSAEGMLAAGTFSRWVGLYDDHGNGGAVATFPLQSQDDRLSQEEGLHQGTGITQLLWSPCARYLCVIERGSDGVGIWDIRGTGRRLAWLRGRKAVTPQRLSTDIVGQEVWAGGGDGRIRVWEGLGTKEGIIDPVWEFKAHDGTLVFLLLGQIDDGIADVLKDAVCATALHPSGSVLATASGQRHFFHTDCDETGEADAENNGHLAKAHGSSLKVWAL